MTTSRHIVIVNHNAGSPYHGPNFRSYYAAQGWVKRGLKATIVCSSFSHKLHHLPDVQGNHSVEMIDGIRYIWLKTKRFSGNVGRLRNYLEFRQALNLLPKILSESVDVVVCSSPPPIWLWFCRSFALSKDAALIFEARDLWPDVIFETSRLGYLNPVAWYMRFAERAAYRHSDAVVAVNESAVKLMARRGLDPNRFKAIPNGTDVSDMDAPAVESEGGRLSERLRLEGGFVVGYSGALSSIYGLGYLMGAARVLRSSNIHFVLAGTGPYESELRRFATELPNVHLVGWIPKNALQGFLESVDLCYASLLNVPSFTFGSDSTKLYEYMKAARPILHAIADENSVVKQAQCGLRVASESVEALVAGLRELSMFDPVQLAALGEKGRSYLCEHRSYDVLASKWMDVFDSFLGKSNQ